jgi:hypothetical protein
MTIGQIYTTVNNVPLELVAIEEYVAAYGRVHNFKVLANDRTRLVLQTATRNELYLGHYHPGEVIRLTEPTSILLTPPLNLYTAYMRGITQWLQ